MVPFPVDIAQVRAAEAELGVRFPPDYVVRVCRSNGGEVLTGPDEVWWLHPIRDPSDRKRLARSCNDVVRETALARQWIAFPAEAIAIAENGCGDRLLLLPVNNADIAAGDPASEADEARSRLDDAVYAWDHETGEVQQVAIDFSELG